MRKGFIAGNWKMNLDTAQAVELARAVCRLATETEGVDVAIAPAFTALAVVLQETKQSQVAVAAQNCHWETKGAYTGEVSAELLRDMGCSHVIIGHSERRQFFGETDETVNKKVHAAHRAGLLPIVCVGESLAQREANRTDEVVASQVRGALDGVSSQKLSALTLAYEPVWAIGTGKTATGDQAQAVHTMIRKLLSDLVDANLAQQVRIQYGGSVKPSNVSDLMARADIDGALVGGASLTADSFRALIRYQDN